MWRIANTGTLHFRSYPEPRHRFDAPHGEYSALYACASDIGAFAEVYGDRARILELAEGQRYLLQLVPRTALPLLDLHNVEILAMLDLDERISVGDDYACCQAWALAIYRQFPDIVGIRYRARKAGASVANIFLYADRCADVIDVASARRLNEIEEVVLRAAGRYRLTVYLDFHRVPR